MGFGFLPWERLPAKYRGVPFSLAGILILTNTIYETPFEWIYFSFSLALIAVGPIVLLSAVAQSSTQFENENDE